VNSAITNMDVLISLPYAVIFSFTYVFRSGLVRSYSSSASSFLRNFQIVFHSGCSNL
jgi:ABC-type uncharacterized transport system permease subunit